jgi:hypothetical protein
LTNIDNNELLSSFSIQQIAFRVYTESLWYPGRQFNLINAKQSIPRKSMADLTAAVAAAGISGSAKDAAGASGGGTPIKCTT